MSTSILVVEHEPRYAERMKEALAGRQFDWLFAKDGEEALHLLQEQHPNLVILSSVIPKISTADLIRQIKSRSGGETTPILITVSGYTGRNPKADAMRLGADDIIPKPFPDSVFADKVQQLLKLQEGPKLTSDEIFGDITDDKSPPKSKPHKLPTQNVDELLEQTLTGLHIPSGLLKKSGTSAPAHAPAKTRTPSDVDRLVQNTLSGLEKSVRPKSAPKPAPVAAAPPLEEKVLASSPVFPPTVPTTDAPAEEEDEATGKFGQYVLVERIARGGMAEVWKARMRGVEGFQKIVAIKKILPHLSEDADFVKMFIDEAKLAAQLNHNNIIHIYDLGKIGHSYYIAMEYVEGHDLKGILKHAAARELPIPVELALFIASKIAAALDYAHRKRDFEQKEIGIVHRDVSPQNILISAEGDIKLCDFGIAKAATKASPHTQAGALKGKIQYMSPEQAWGKPIDRRSDIFALAAVLFEMLTGRRAFPGDNEISILEQVREARVEPPSSINDEVPPEIDSIVLKALSRDPEVRYQSAAEMARDIDALLYGYRPTPTSADLAIYLDRLYSAEPATVMMPLPEVEPPAPPPPPPPVTTIAATEARPPLPAETLASVAPAESRRRPARRLLVPLAAAALLAVAAIGAVVVMQRDDRAPAPAAVSATRQPEPAQTAQTFTPSPTVSSTTAPAEEIVPITDTARDQALIDQEVNRRIAAERARLERQRNQELGTERTREATRPEPVLRSEPAEERPAMTRSEPVVPPQPATETVAESRPVEQPAPPPTATSAPVAETVAPAQAQSRPVREGELVEIGTPGLIEPELVNMRKVAYPPVAKLQKVEGIVVVRALVSETGRVMEATVLRGVQKNVGLNEAALDMVRGATFRPATKDGVRVRSYKTVMIPFKL